MFLKLRIISRFAAFKIPLPYCQSFIIQQREYRGSNRYKRMKEQSEKLRLEKELEQKYGISSRTVFNFKDWIKENYLKELGAFQVRLNTLFNNNGVLISAFTHSSFLNELNISVEPGTPENKDEERLKKLFEFQSYLSDVSSEKLALIGYEFACSTVKSFLYKEYPNLTTSACHDIMMFLTSRETINNLAKNLAMDELMLMSNELENVDINEEMHINFTKEDAISDTVFAFIGAIEKDQGFQAAESFVKDFIIALIYQEELSKYVNIVNPYNELKKILQMNGITSKPVAKIISETGVRSDFPFYYIGVYCDSIKIGEGSGYSVKTGQQDAYKNTVFKCFDKDVNFESLRQTLQSV